MSEKLHMAAYLDNPDFNWALEINMVGMSKVLLLLCHHEDL